MNYLSNPRGRSLPARKSVQNMAIASAVALLMATGAAQAQTAAPAESAMVKLIRGLIQSGTLNKDVGEALLAQAQTEAMAAQQAQRQVAAAAAAAAPVAGTAAMRPEAGDVRVPYISQTVRDQIRDEVKGQVMAQARTEGWAAPNETPEWSKRIRIEGDMRLRNESRYYSKNNNDITIDWPTINRGTPYDVNPNTVAAFAAQPNFQQDRKNLWRARARFGVLADISENTTAGVRLATGSDDSPVSTTQTLGGGLNKKDIWLDQAWISHKATDWLTITGGRFGNPFVSTDMLFSNDLNFDGVAAKFNKTLSNENVSLFGTLGVIPLEYSSDNSPREGANKMRSETKWLLAAQVGANWKLDSINRFRAAAAYYGFQNVSGKVSSPCSLFTGQTSSCDTDWSRPAFMQKGNTLMLLRNIVLNPNATGPNGQVGPAYTPMPQYAGLASEFRLLDLNARWDTKVMGNYNLRLDANYIRNLAYDADKIFARAAGSTIVNNFDGSGLNQRENFQSGGNAYMVQATLGMPSPSTRGDWNMMVNYKYIEPDAMPDGFNDSSFHLGGTNARGYTVGGSYAFDKNTWLTGRWMASKAVFGPPLSIDVLQLELNTRF